MKPLTRASPGDYDIVPLMSDQDILLRLVTEAELNRTGRATSTGIHLVLYWPEVCELGAWELGQLWGYSVDELERMQAEGERLVAVRQTPGAHWGRAQAENLVQLALTERHPETRDFAAAELLAALRLTVEEAELAGLRPAQKILGQIFGLRDPIFGSGRLPTRQTPVNEIPPYSFFMDEKITPRAASGLLPGSALSVNRYSPPAIVTPLRWPAE